MQSTATQESARPRTIVNRRYMQWIALAFGLPAFGGVGAFYLTQPTASENLTPRFAIAPQNSPQSVAQQIAAPLGDVIERVVTRNDTLDRIFRQAQLRMDDLATIRSLPGMRSALDTLKPGELITLTHIDGVLQKLTRRLSDTELLTVSRDASGFSASVLDTPLQIRTAEARGTINSSLFNAARAAGVSSDLIMRLANDVFGWDIDFALEIQPRDTFKIIYEQKYREGDYLGDGDILAAEFVNEGHVYRAIRFRSADGALADYFTPDGKSMRRQFLRAPVEFKYISSNFNPHRFHPILNIVRAHQGVDYSAPTGTPVRASGDGRIASVGVQGGYGNAIVLEHGGGVSTLYGHLSRFSKNLHTGSRVKQGDVIGYVGSTGTATGPHLHYEYRINGVHKNPRTVVLPDADPIPPSYLAEFDAAKAQLLSRLDAVQIERVATARR